MFRYYFKSFIPILALSAGLLFPQRITAEETPTSGFKTASQLQKQGFEPLFTESDLSKWKLSEGHRGHWVAKEGMIDYDGKATAKKHVDRGLWTKKSYRETEFYVEWRFPDKPVIKQHPIVLWNGNFLMDEKGKRITRPHLDAGDSGILFRGILDCQANIWCQEMGSGEINGYRTNKSLGQILRRSCIPFEFGDNPLGEWNAFLITLKDDRLKVELNGKLVLYSEKLPNLPESGSIGLQHHGDHIQFRNIWVKEIKCDE